MRVLRVGGGKKKNLEKKTKNKKHVGTKTEQCYHSLLFLPFLLPTHDSTLSSVSYLIT